MGVGQGGAGVVAALAWFPGRGGGLGEGEGCVGGPGGAGGFDVFEVGVGVALDVFSGVLLGRGLCRIIS